jgi:hypothetical protein
MTEIRKTPRGQTVLTGRTCHITLRVAAGSVSGSFPAVLPTAVIAHQG